VVVDHTFETLHTNKEFPMSSFEDNNRTNSLEAMSLDDLTLSHVEIEELQNEDALGIPELGATGSLYSCTSYCSL
jgi:hypothetical protein